MTAAEILDALIAVSCDKIWATELAFFSGARRIDFWTLEPAQSAGFRASAFEIKCTRGDFQRDCEVKQEGALTWSDRFWYVTPPGLLMKDDLPAWAGLQEWNGTSFAVIRKAPKRQKAPPSWELVVSIIRNSGECRRDIGVMKAQIAYLQQEAERSRQQDRMRNQFAFDRFLRRAPALGACEQ